MQKNFSRFLIFFVLFIILIPPLPSYAESKTIFLTFDDGPGGKVTQQVLDILREKNVKATFFLIGEQLKNQETLVKQIDSDGHSIGLHSISHNKSKLYCSNQSFLNEMLQEQNLLYQITNKKYTIIRFPFGCNNSCYHLTENLVDLLHQNDFKIYDWNVDTTDGANHTASPETYIKRAKSDKDTIFLLMHCGFMNKNSPKALPEIITYYKEKGYTFKTIDSDTEEIYHYIKKSS